MKKLISVLLTMLLALQMFAVVPAFAAEEAFTVDEVIAMLEGIDTLQQMQDKRSTFTVSKHYNANNAATVTMHEKARIGYETYVAEMFAARAQAQQAYDSLRDEQKAEIDPVLVAKLSDELPNIFNTQTFPIEKSDTEYSYQLICPNFMVYEVSNAFIKTGDVAGTFMMVDTATAGETWTPDGVYVYGESNYELVYCCDLQTLPTHNTHYKRTNLEASDYYDAESAAKIRAIVQQSYPFLTIDEMKAKLVADGMDAELVASLTRSDLITSVQMAIWAYANVNDESFNYENVTQYGGSLRMKNHPYIPKIMHDYTNECWNWWSQKTAYRSFDPAVEARVNALVAHLCAVEPVEAEKDQIVISELEVVDASLIDMKGDTYYVTLYVNLNGGGNAADELQIMAESFSLAEDGTKIVTDTATEAAVSENGTCQVKVCAKSEDQICVTVEGQQMLAKGAYFYDAGSRDVSQAMVGVSEGFTPVSVSSELTFTEDMVKVDVTDIETNVGDSVEMTQGDELQINASVKPDDATVQELLYSSSDDIVATVDSTGKITAVAQGECVITITSADNPSVYKEITVIVTAKNKKTHYICFGKTDGIGWYEISVNGGDPFLQGPNSTLEVEEGATIVVRVKDLGFGDQFTFYVNGKKVESTETNGVTLTVDGYMLIGALSMDMEVPDVEESLNWFQKLIKAFKDFFAWLGSLFTK